MKYISSAIALSLVTLSFAASATSLQCPTSGISVRCDSTYKQIVLTSSWGNRVAGGAACTTTPTGSLILTQSVAHLDTMSKYSSGPFSGKYKALNTLNCYYYLKTSTGTSLAAGVLRQTNSSVVKYFSTPSAWTYNYVLTNGYVNGGSSGYFCIKPGTGCGTLNY